jgi:plastocyanin
VRRILLAVVTAGLALSLGGCSLWGMEGGPGGTGAVGPSASSGPSPVDAVAGPDGVQRITITMGDDLRLHPSLVRAHPGAIEFTFRNTGATPHDVEFQGVAGGTGNLNGGASTTVRVSVAQPGTYPFPCVYHQSSGMTGSLIVS